MKKLISLFLAVLVALPLYSNEPEYICINKQFNTVVVNVPAVVSCEKDSNHSIKITNKTFESYLYEVKNDTLVIKLKNNININFSEMVPDSLEIKLKHPSPSKVSVATSRRELNLVIRPKSGDQN